MVYRPSDFKFPASRGREGFEIMKSGEFVQYAIGRDDRSNKIIGHVNADDQNRLYIRFDDPQLRSYVLKILMCDDKVLKVEKKSI